MEMAVKEKKGKKPCDIKKGGEEGATPEVIKKPKGVLRATNSRPGKAGEVHSEKSGRVR